MATFKRATCNKLRPATALSFGGLNRYNLVPARGQEPTLFQSLVTDQSATLQSLPGIRAAASAGLRPFVATAVGLVIVVALACSLSWRTTAQIHMLMEVAAACLALIAGTVALVRHQARDDKVFLFIGCGFLGSAMLDGYHVAVTAEGVSRHLPSALSELTPWSWLASRLWLSVCLYLSWLVWRHPLRRKSISDLSIYVMTALIVVGCGLLFALVPLPQANYPLRFLHRPAELIPAAFFALALVGYLKKEAWREDSLERWLVCSLMVAVVAQWLVMSLSNETLDGPFALAHLLKIISTVMVIAGLIVGVSEAFSEVDRLTRLRDHNVAELARTREDLNVFLRSVSHDLKAPVRHITGFCGFILEDAKDRLTETETEDLNRIRDAASQMSALIESLVEFARLDTATLKHTEFSLNDLVENVVIQLPREQQSRVTCGQLTEVRADRTMLTLVLQNLIDNGLRYTRDPDSQVVVRSESLPEGTVVSVTDAGIGVDESQKTRIFEPGVRGVSDSEFQGTGFGLATCARIIAAHEGRIWVESNPEEGSTFHVLIPQRNDQRSMTNVQ